MKVGQRTRDDGGAGVASDEAMKRGEGGVRVAGFRGD